MCLPCEYNGQSSIGIHHFPALKSMPTSTNTYFPGGDTPPHGELYKLGQKDSTITTFTK